MAQGVNNPLYTIEILRLAASIPHLGPLEDADRRAILRSPTCGSTMTVEVKLDEQGRVAALGQQVEQLGGARFFSFGVGTAVNRYIIEGIAHVGMGEPFIVTEEKDLSKVVQNTNFEVSEGQKPRILELLKNALEAAA